MRVPFRHVAISRMRNEAKRSGAQAPSNSFRRFEARKVASISRKGSTSAAAAAGFQFHRRQMMMKASDASTTIVVVTAMP